MQIEMNTRIDITACAMVLLLDEFGNELIEEIEKGTITEDGDIMAFARNKTVAYFNNHSANEEGVNDECK